jgi:hypothetical protein
MEAFHHVHFTEYLPMHSAFIYYLLCADTYSIFRLPSPCGQLFGVGRGAHSHTPAATPAGA